MALRIAEVLASPNPDVSIAGRTISKGQYLEQLYRAQAELEKARLRADGPWEIRSRART